MPGTHRPTLLAGLLALLAAVVTVALPARGALAAGAEPSHDPTPVREPVMTVLSYNIHHGVGEDGRLDLPRIADVIATSGADVAALAEVDRHWSARSDWADQAAVLAGMLGMHVAYGANLDLDPPAPGEPRRQYGTAILSRHPIVSAHNTLLPNLGGEQRGLLAARLVVAGRPVLVHATHLQHNSATERAAQTAAIVDLVGSATEPVVLAGDLNAAPGAPELAPLEASFVDTHTASAGPGLTYPASGPTARIDYVLGNDAIRPLASQVLDTQASDHLPVRARLRVTAPYADVTPLAHAHAHNDYEHRRPLFDALHHGFTSVEADVWLVDGELRVAHDLADARPGRTLESAYLDPLADIVRANRGRVYPARTAPVQLLVDIKSAAEPTWLALEKALVDYRPMLTRFGPQGAAPAAVEVVVSGNRPRELMAGELVRWSAYDGRLGDLGGPDAQPGFMPLISDRWTGTFTWDGVGPMPADEAARLSQIVATAHGDGQRVRFWATPDSPGPARDAVWARLLDAGVDHINTDDLAGLRDFLLERLPQP